VIGIALLTNGVIIARATGTAGKGIFTLVVTGGQLGAAIFGLRWERSVGHFLARDRRNLEAIVWSAVLVAASALVLAWLVSLIVPNLLSAVVLKGLPGSSQAMVWCLIAIQSLSASLAATYGGMRRFGLRSAFLAASAASLIVPSITLFLLGASDVTAYVRAYVAASAALTGGWFLVIALRGRIRPRADGPLLWKMSRYASFAFLSTLLDLLTIRLDVFVLNYLGSASSVGVYSVAVGLAARLAMLPNIVAHVVFHRVSANEIGAGETTAKLVRVTAAAMCVAGAGVAIAGRVLIVPLYGREFSEAVGPLYVMIPATLFWGLFRLIASDVEGRGRPGLVGACSSVATVCIVSLDLLWIPRYGVMGAAWASLIAYGVALGAAAWAFCRQTGMRPAAAYIPRFSDVSSLCTAFAGLKPVGDLATVRRAQR
jgi:O-antigen/teichoic acid export membrane protein